MNLKAKNNSSSIILLIVVGFILLVIAGITLPSLLQSKMYTREAYVSSLMRLIVQCAVSYETGHPDTGYPAQATDMGPGNDGCLDGPLTNAASGRSSKSGYQFTYAVTAQMGKNISFTLTAVPLYCGWTGVRTYFSDESGVLRFSNDCAANCPVATISSPPMQ